MKQAPTVLIALCATFLGFFAGRLSVGNVPLARPLQVVAATPSPPSVLPPAATPPDAIRGRIAELIQVPSYTYLRLETASGQAWAAVPTNHAVKQGDEVTLGGAMVMRGFHSATLNRTFESIYFAQLVTY